MKPIHIVLIIVAAIGVAIVVSFMGNTTKYVGFKEARTLAAEYPDKDFHVVCKLDKAKPLEYDPQKNADKLVFYAIDTLGAPAKVIYNNTKPADMERAEARLVLIGKFKGETFNCTEILSKCPSKYNDNPVAEQK